MKKILIPLVLVLIAALILVGCSSSTPAPTAPASSSASAPTTSSAPPAPSAAPKTSAPPTSSAPASATSPTAAASQGVIKIGHLRPLTGGTAMQSQQMIQAFDFAFQQVNYQVAGKQIQLITGDTKADPQTAVTVAQKMVQSDHVSLLLGPMMGPEVCSVANYANQAGIPQLLTNSATTATIDPKYKWTISLGGIPAQFTSAIGDYAYKTAGFKKIDIMSADFIDGHDYLGTFAARFKSDGGQVVQEQYTPFPTEDFSTYLTGLKAADAVAAWYLGGEAITFLSQYHQLGIDKRMPVVAAFDGAFVEPFILSALPPEASAAMVGGLLSCQFTPLLDNPLSKQFVADYQAKFNVIPQESSYNAYAGGLAVIQALKATGGDASPDKLLQALLATNVNTPSGTLKVDPQNHGATFPLYICKIAKQGNAFVWQPVYTYNDIPSTGLK